MSTWPHDLVVRPVVQGEYEQWLWRQPHDRAQREAMLRRRNRRKPLWRWLENVQPNSPRRRQPPRNLLHKEGCNMAAKKKAPAKKKKAKK